jgi:formylglycine-generating enzyme required for sulfatase activity
MMEATNARRRLIYLFLLAMILFLPGICHAQSLKHGLFIGNETFDEEQLPKLNYAEDDARGLAAEFENLGFATITMTSDAPKEWLRPSNPEKILDQVQETLKKLGKNDTFILSLSGHGINYEDEEPLASGVKETYFCPSDANLEKKETLLPLSKLIDIISESDCGYKLLLIDCCREELAIPAKEGARAATARRLELNPVYENERVAPGGLEVIFSCSSKERSWEFGELGESGHGVFSYFVLEYLRGNAPQDFYQEGNLHLDSLVLFARSKTAEYVFQQKARSQTPVRHGGGNDLLLGKLLTRVFTNSIEMKFVRIPAGEFDMGSDQFEKPVHEVRISKPFYMATTEVTQEQWESLMHTTPWQKNAKDRDYAKSNGKHAASYISWDDAVEFCKKLSAKDGKTFRLPTEAEWEYACRAGSKTEYSFGDDESKLSDYAWWGGVVGDGNAKDENYAHAVEQLKPNAFGLYDMHGNVYEWCQDKFDPDYYKKATMPDPVNLKTGSSRVLRGGSWLFTEVYCRSAYRYLNDPSERYDNVGFRVVCELE